MLVLTRKKGQTINIGHNIKIMVVDIQKDHVRIGIEAPDDVDIFRAEVYQAIQKENLQALAGQDVIKSLGHGLNNRDSNNKNKK